MNVRCIISLVFILKLGKIVIVKEENSPLKWRVFLYLLFYSNRNIPNHVLEVLI